MRNPKGIARSHLTSRSCQSPPHAGFFVSAAPPVTTLDTFTSNEAEGGAYLLENRLRPILRLPPGSGAAPDFFISPTGSDSNDGLTTSTPWAITALNTKRATYSPSGVGKTIGFMSGTYDISSLMTTSRDVPALDVEGGTAGHPVILKSISPRGAIITAGGATPYNVVNSMIGHSPSRQQGYVEIDGLYITGGRTIIVEIGQYGVSSNVPGIKIRNCEITGNSDLNSNPGGSNTPGSGGGNAAGITFNNCLNPDVFNCYIHDNTGHSSGSADHICGIIVWLSRGTQIRQTTCINTGYGVYGKETVNQGTLVERCYLDISSLTSDQGQIYDFAGAPTAGLTDTSIFRNNILISYAGANLRDNLDAGGWTTNCEFYNNTIIGPITGAGLSFFADSSHNRTLKFYNNVIKGSAGGYGNLCITASACTLIDYNLYEGLSWSTVPDGALTTISTTNYTTLANWRTAMAGSTGAEASSATGAATFTNTGARALQYTTTSGLAFQTGRTGGTSGGSVCHKGAWDGTVTQIGSDF